MYTLRNREDYVYQRHANPRYNLLPMSDTASNTIFDQEARLRALDVSCSFIVQAPAGSGKTELLMQRFLSLLAVVREPEEILAITFTRKAAGEMRQRILLALQRARDDVAFRDTTSGHLAHQALIRDQAMSWRLCEHPARLRIMTIDAFCSSLVKRMPLLAELGVDLSITEDPKPLYRQAAQAVITALGEAPWSNAIERLLQHVDNQVERVLDMLVRLLAKRDQWLRHVIDQQNPALQRAHLEQAIARSVQNDLLALQTLWPAHHVDELQQLAKFASEHHATLGSSLQQLSHAWPQASAADHSLWQTLASWLLTSDGQWRRRVDKVMGFPASAAHKADVARYKMHKQRMQALLDELANDEQLADVLSWVQELPSPHYPEAQWKLLQSLLDLLPTLVAQLRLLFQETGKMDFIELTQAALRALGDEQSPTDLALWLDNRLQHMLIDEFQDTSIAHDALFRKLTAGWQLDDGRTLFVVGDPMQSIYRFREAEVGLFLQAWQHGLGDVALEPLRLCMNFRSELGIVEWVNTGFHVLFPQHMDIAMGWVPYHAAVAYHPSHNELAVFRHQLDHQEEETHTMIALVQQSWQTHTGDIAVLVRNREHLQEVLPALRALKIPVQALEFERLMGRSIIQDLLALTQALLQPCNEVAWLAILRAPWCGLTLADLYALIQPSTHLLPWQRIQQEDILQTLTEEGQQRLRYVKSVLAKSFANMRRVPLCTWVEQTWQALRGPLCLQHQDESYYAEQFFNVLEQFDKAYWLLDEKNLLEKINRLFATAATEHGRCVQVMTIHKAKGLEFDTVIVAGLSRTLSVHESQLLLWWEHARSDEGSDLLLAPIKASIDEEDPLYRYIKKLHQRKDRAETLRLLYVAATRAKRALHWVYHFDESEKNDPPKDSLLAHLWPTLSLMPIAEKFPLAGRPPQQTKQWRRFPQAMFDDAHLSAIAPSISTTTQHQGGMLATEISWHAHYGRVIHYLLQQTAHYGLKVWEKDTQTPREYFTWLLQQEGIPSDALTEGLKLIEQALHNIQTDLKAHWILHAHQDAHHEYALSGLCDGAIQHVVLDRTFVDAEGQRWIIDYKTAYPRPSQTLAQFIAEQYEQHAPQLKRYATLFRQHESRPIRLGLYWPLVPAWHEWVDQGSD